MLDLSIYLDRLGILAEYDGHDLRGYWQLQQQNFQLVHPQQCTSSLQTADSSGMVKMSLSLPVSAHVSLLRNLQEMMDPLMLQLEFLLRDLQEVMDPAMLQFHTSATLLRHASIVLTQPCLLFVSAILVAFRNLI